MHDVRPIDCERTRQQISAALDSELSQLELALVRNHVAQCQACRSFEARVFLATRTLREALPARLTHAISVPARRPPAWAPARIVRLGSAAAAMVALVFFALLSAPTAGSPSSEHALVGAVLAQGGTSELLALRPPPLAPSEQDPLAQRSGGIGAHKPPLSPVL
jgi:predicted anti-sigma-YlaC factor YlaD